MNLAHQDESKVISFSLSGYARYKNLFENAGPGDNWFSPKSLKAIRTVINYPDLNYAYPTVMCQNQKEKMPRKGHTKFGDKKTRIPKKLKIQMKRLHEEG